MLRLGDGQVECLWDEVLPEEARALPEDLQALDELLRDPAVLRPIKSHWRQQDAAAGRSAASRGRPTISMQTYVRLMVVKHRTGWGYETLMREVSDSLHLRRFCLIALGERVPDESTVRKLTRKLGAAVVNELTRVVIDRARREKRFRPRAARIDSTVVEADVRYPTDSGLARDSARVLAREARKLLVKVGRDAGHVRDRSRAIGRRVRAMTRTLGRRTGERKQQVLELTEQAAKQMQRSIREAKRLVVVARRRARGRGAKAKLRQIDRFEAFVERSERVAEQIRKRMCGERITDRLVSIFDPDARPIRKGKLGKPNEFGFVAQICELTENTKTGARGLIIPATSEIGNPQEDTLLPDTVAELERLGISPREVALDGGFNVGPTRQALERFEPERTLIAGRQQPGSRRTQRRLARYRTGTEGRISHLKRGYGLRRTRLKDHQGMQTWTGWSILTYNLDTLAVRTS
jgi:transposase, IS5 family